MQELFHVFLWLTSVRVRLMENGTLRTQNYSYTYNDDKQPESTTYGNVTETFTCFDAAGRPPPAEEYG